MQILSGWNLNFKDWWLPALLVLIGVLYLLSKSVFLVHPTNDYQFIWLAGFMWATGTDPYAMEYTRLGQDLFFGQFPPQVWFYPPNWWPIATISAQTSFETGVIIWRTMSAACVVFGTAAVSWAYSRHVRPVSNLRIAFFFFFACCMSGTPIAMAIGQTSFLSFFGVALFIAANLSSNRALMVLALFLLMLKPQIGLPFCLFLLGQSNWWPSLIAAGLVSIGASIPALEISGIGNFLSAYIGSFSFHENMLPNHPRAMTGIRNLAYDVFGWYLSPLGLTLSASLAAFGLGLANRRVLSNQGQTLSLLLVIVSMIVALHTYDMIILTPAIVLTASLKSPFQMFVFFGLLLIFRSNNLAELTGFFDQTTTHFRGSRLTTLGLLVIATALVTTLITHRKTGAA